MRPVRFTSLGGYFRELARPWKLVTFAIGTAFFVWGALYWQRATWDVGVSLLMSVSCFLIAPWAIDLAVAALYERHARWKRDLVIASALVYFVASGSYEIYNTIRMGGHPVTYWWNLAFSVPVTIIAGAMWRYQGSLSDFAREARSAMQAARSRTRELGR